MDLSDLKDNKTISSVIWTYDLQIGFILDEMTLRNAEKILNNLLDEIIPIKDIITEPPIKDLFKKTVLDLEILLKTSPLNEAGVYEYGGLNEFFADIMESLGFQVEKGEFALVSDFVYWGT